MNGRGKEAINFYEKHLGATCVFKETYKDNLVSHSVLKLKTGGTLMINEDPLDNKDYKFGNRQSICVQTSNQEDIRNLYIGLTSDKETQIIQELIEVPFSPLYGICKDKFNIIWQFFTVKAE